MKIIIPVAGVGTRLRPHTHATPKVLMKTAGKTVLEHILNDILTLNPDEIIFIIGYLGEKIKDFIKKTYSNIKTAFIEQKEFNGLGSAINLARDYIDNKQSLLIILGDTLIKTNLSNFIKSDNNVIAVKNVNDPRKFGVIETNGDFIKRFVEKPEYPPSNLAVVGLYFIKTPDKLFNALDYIINNNIKTKNEYQLTDALQYMVEIGEKFSYYTIDKWLDCGNKENLLETNRELLTEMGSSIKGSVETSIFIDPVFIHPDSKIKNSVIGPYVSVSEGAKITGSIINNSIICENAEINNIALTSSLISDNTYISDSFRVINIGSHAEIDLSSNY